MEARLKGRGCELEFEDVFDGEALDERRSVAHYLPQWSSRARSAARYRVAGGCLRLRESRLSGGSMSSASTVATW